VLQARIEGRLEWGGDPEIVWYPEKGHLNPSRHPSEAGHWEYYTEYDEQEAHINFGGDQEFPMPPRPTAQEFWKLRQALRNTARKHTTDRVRLLWIPDDLYDPPASDHASSQHPAETVDPTVGTGEPGADKLALAETNLIPITDQVGSSQEQTDPTNGDQGGVRDHTGAVEKAEYWQIEADGVRIVIDRAAPWRTSCTWVDAPEACQGKGLCWPCAPSELQEVSIPNTDILNFSLDHVGRPREPVCVR